MASHAHADHEHGHEAGHAHHHGAHGHSHAPAHFGGAFAVGTALNFGYVLVQVAFGWWAHSLALLADAGHNLGDVLGLLLAWWASCLVKSRPTKRHTYGLGRSSILAAITNAAILLVAVVAISGEAVLRLRQPVPVEGGIVMAVAAVGILVNAGTALLFMRGRKEDLNRRGAFLHMAADALVSLGVVAAGAAIWLTGWLWIDPAVSLGVNVVILWASWAVVRDSVDLALDAVPVGISTDEVRRHLASMPGVVAVHDLHVWALSTTQTALTAHLIKPDAEIDDALLARICEELRHRFGISHATIQLEKGDRAHPCALESEQTI